ncbi:MAG: type II secretion system F family protein [Gemmataceae bacterium]
MAIRIPTSALVQFTRMVRVGLEAGLPIVDVFQKQGVRGPYSVRPVAARIGERLAKGDTFTDAIQLESAALPPLFLALSEVGEETGHLAESFGELEEYFELQDELQKDFRMQTMLPKMEFFAAIGVICLLYMILAALDLPVDPLGLGRGFGAIVRFLSIIAVFVGTMYFIVWGIKNRLRFLAPVERVILRIPVLGPALESVLLARFSLGLRFTLGAGLTVPKAMKYSIYAAASSLYQQAFEKAQPGLRRGETLVEVLERCQVFPHDFIDIVANAEETGQVPEVMAKQAKHYQDETRRRLKILTRVAGWLVYAMVAGMIIFMIFKMYLGVYLPRFNEIKF